jgi:hypothetical protein
MDQLNSWQLIGVIVGAVVLGAFVTLLVQWGMALRDLAREATHTSHQVTELIDSLKPVMTRVNRFSALAEDSEPDLRRMQLALHHFSEASVQLTESLTRVSGWVGVAAPLVATAFERWSHPSRQDAPEPSPDMEPSEPPTRTRGPTAKDGPAVVYPPV